MILEPLGQLSHFISRYRHCRYVLIGHFQMFIKSFFLYESERSEQRSEDVSHEEKKNTGCSDEPLYERCSWKFSQSSESLKEKDPKTCASDVLSFFKFYELFIGIVVS